MTGPQYFGRSVLLAYANPVRAGYSLDPTDILYGTPRDAADDNYNSYDPFGPSQALPVGHAVKWATRTFTTTREHFCFPSIACGAG